MLSPTTEDRQYMCDDYPHIQVPGSKIDKAPTLERCHGISLLRALEEAGPESQQQQKSTTSQLGCQQRIMSALCRYRQHVRLSSSITYSGVNISGKLALTAT